MNTAHTLVDWWNQMATIYGRYGTAREVERTPEWLRLRTLQRRLITEMGTVAGADSDVLLDSLCDVVEEQGDRPLCLDLPRARRMTAEIMRRAALAQVYADVARGMLN